MPGEIVPSAAVVIYDTDKKETVLTKSACIAVKKISDKYKKIRNKKNANLVEEIQEVASKKKCPNRS